MIMISLSTIDNQNRTEYTLQGIFPYPTKREVGKIIDPKREP